MKKLLCCLFIIPILHSSVQAADKIRIGFSELIASYSSLPLAQKRGFLQEEGLQAEFIRMNTTVGLTTLVTGEIDYYTQLAGGVAAVIRGVPVKIVACYVPGPTATLIARPEFKSVQELRGKTVGINVFGSNLDIIARNIFKHSGLDPDKDIKFLAGGPLEARFSSMKQGLIAATFGGPPADFLGKKMGFVVLARAHELFSFPVTGVLSSVKKIKEKPDEIKRVIRAGIKANRYIRQNRDGTIQTFMEWLKIDKEMATATYDSVGKSFNEDGSLPEDGLRLLIEEAKKAAKVSREIASSEVADLSILREAQKELGIK
ncbi:MAG TPA: ABC transporter substrate-binding protein [Candidatus Binatia bacterium]|jgi:ABC-type nitrate/sulfonate/bicarbonate transport system substrate-binding protein